AAQVAAEPARILVLLVAVDAPHGDVMLEVLATLQYLDRIALAGPGAAVYGQVAVLLRPTRREEYRRVAGLAERHAALDLERRRAEWRRPGERAGFQFPRATGQRQVAERSNALEAVQLLPGQLLQFGIAAVAHALSQPAVHLVKFFPRGRSNR